MIDNSSSARLLPAALESRFLLEEGPSSVPWQATAVPIKILEKDHEKWCDWLALLILAYNW